MEGGRNCESDRERQHERGGRDIEGELVDGLDC